MEMRFQIVKVCVKVPEFVVRKFLDPIKDNISEFLLCCHKSKLPNFHLEDQLLNVGVVTDMNAYRCSVRLVPLTVLKQKLTCCLHTLSSVPRQT